jgi:hypothetical protein
MGNIDCDGLGTDTEYSLGGALQHLYARNGTCDLGGVQILK